MNLTFEAKFFGLIEKQTIVSSPHVDTPCWMWKGRKNKNGYGHIRFGHEQLAHRLSFLIHGGTIKKIKPCVLHRCDNPTCVNPKHLIAGTHTENMRDMFSKGRRKNTAKGERQHSHVFTEAEVLEIRSKYAAGGHTHKSLAKPFGVNRSSIRKIVNRWTWKHI